MNQSCGYLDWGAEDGNFFYLDACPSNELSECSIMSCPGDRQSGELASSNDGALYLDDSPIPTCEYLNISYCTVPGRGDAFAFIESTGNQVSEVTCRYANFADCGGTAVVQTNPNGRFIVSFSNFLRNVPGQIFSYSVNSEVSATTCIFLDNAQTLKHWQLNIVCTDCLGSSDTVRPTEIPFAILDMQLCPGPAPTPKQSPAATPSCRFAVGNARVEVASACFIADNVVFSGLYSTGMGGAVLISDATATMICRVDIFAFFAHCSFFDCHSGTWGGACAISLMKADLDSCCASGCYAAASGNFAYLAGLCAVSSFNMTTIVSCAPSPANLGTANAGALELEGLHTFELSSINFTSCLSTTGGAAITTEAYAGHAVGDLVRVSFNCRLSTFYNCAGSNVLSLPAEGSRLLEDCNFVSNLASCSGCSLISISLGDLLASRCYFVESVSPFSVTSPGQVTYTACGFKNGNPNVGTNGGSNTFNYNGQGTSLTHIPVGGCPRAGPAVPSVTPTRVRTPTNSPVSTVKDTTRATAPRSPVATLRPTASPLSTVKDTTRATVPRSPVATLPPTNSPIPTVKDTARATPPRSPVATLPATSSPVPTASVSITPTSSGCDILRNQTTQVYYPSYSRCVEVHESVFVDLPAREGGGIYALGAGLTATTSTFYRCTAYIYDGPDGALSSGYGGAIKAGGYLIVSECCFRECDAGYVGCAIESMGSAGPVISDTTIVQCGGAATKGSGVIFDQSTNTKGSYRSLNETANTGAQNGRALCSREGAWTFTFCTVAQCDGSTVLYGENPTGTQIAHIDQCNFIGNVVTNALVFVTVKGFLVTKCFFGESIESSRLFRLDSAPSSGEAKFQINECVFTNSNSQPDPAYCNSDGSNALNPAATSLLLTHLDTLLCPRAEIMDPIPTAPARTRGRGVRL
jgi:hypothetical protein